MSTTYGSTLNTSPLFNYILNSATRPAGNAQRYYQRSYTPPVEEFEPPKKMGLLKKLFLLGAGFYLGKKILKHLPGLFGQKDVQNGDGLDTLA